MIQFKNNNHTYKSLDPSPHTVLCITVDKLK